MSKEGDLVLVHVEDSPAFFARIECISPDVKLDWYQVTLLVLQVPLVEVTWILKEEYIKGTSFTMGGKRVVMEQVVSPPKEPPSDEGRESRRDAKKKPTPEKDTGKVISLFERK
ncbi:MAG: hypothetical protein JSU80_05215 [Deltaproteobacteria bacterium]|nr:MAG: hypothetical protein JSU80_05215 [Deltaproteobacteria bacterium]